MDYLNFFNIYSKNNAKHEDHITRGFLILLKNSPYVFEKIYQLLINTNSLEKEIFPFNDIKKETIQTQTKSLPDDSNKLYSLLIVDELTSNLKEKLKNIKIDKDNRDAVYDGVIQIESINGDKSTLIMEHKPNSGDVWIKQMNPSNNSLNNKDIEIFQKPLYLTWNKILEVIDQILKSNIISFTEKMLINDFTEYISENRPQLNSFSKLHLCKDNKFKIEKRINTLLKQIIQEEYIEYHRSWGNYLKIDRNYMKQLGIIYDESQHTITIECHPGDTMNQGRAFFNKLPDLTHFLKSKYWDLKPNFHISFQMNNLVWINSKCDFLEYINYWKNNVENLRQIEKDKLKSYLEELQKSNILDKNYDYQIINDKILSKKYKKLNVCPGISIKYILQMNQAEELDKKNKLAKKFKEILDELFDKLRLDKNVLKN